MHENIKALNQALYEMNKTFSSIPHFPDTLIVDGSVFIRAITPFNTESVSILCLDKAALYYMLVDKVLMPKTLQVFDFEGEYSKSRNLSIEHVLTKSLDIFYPRIVKMNKGRKGNHVYVVSNDSETTWALSNIFNRQSQNYDYSALIQEYIEPTSEFRAVVSHNSVAWVYNRKTGEYVSDRTLEHVMGMSEIILETVPLSWGALDFIESKEGKLFFLEANTQPNFNTFISRHGNRLLVDSYKKALTDFIEQ